MSRCPTCNQPLPDTNAQRRDPPLPRLERPDVVTIHDLPEEERAKAQIVNVSPHRYPIYKVAR